MNYIHDILTASERLQMASYLQTAWDNFICVHAQLDVLLNVLSTHIAMHVLTDKAADVLVPAFISEAKRKQFIQQHAGSVEALLARTNVLLRAGLCVNAPEDGPHADERAEFLGPSIEGCPSQLTTTEYGDLIPPFDASATNKADVDVWLKTADILAGKHGLTVVLKAVLSHVLNHEAACAAWADDDDDDEDDDEEDATP